MIVDVVKPWPTAQVNALSHNGVQQSDYARPNPYVSSEITGDRVAPLSQQIQLTDAECGEKQHESRISWRN